MTASARPYRGVSAANRREDRRTRLLTAGLDVVGAVGVADLTVDAVCTRAGLSKRYFYESFADRDALLTEALNTMFLGIAAAIVTELDGATEQVRDRAHRTVDALTRTFEDDPRVARLYLEAAGHPSLRRRRDGAVDEFATLLLERVFGVHDGRETARLAAIVVVAGTMEAVSRWIAGDLALPRHELVARMADLGVAVGATLV